ncbi:DVU_1551 family NTP transferase [Desulfogranum marinum]|uniref:DVU_1551 family NTP transferase n=1 Tax=Desulfogranum marinum TaxID=453220 RepID=UPI0029C6251D|nr:NTP transferase domain-containing protein [Desulfogranum marinum]
MKKLGAIILAAGYSSRMDGFKPLMQLGEHSLVGHCIRLFKTKGIDRVVVVVGHRQQEVAVEVTRQGAEPLFNPDFDKGMFSSVCTAVAKMTELDGFFLLPVDIPLVRPVTIDLLVSGFDGKSVIYPCRDGRRGHPPLIPGHLVKEIIAYTGEGGLRSLLQRFPGKDVFIWDDGAFMDADTAKDFARLAARLPQLEKGSRREAEALAAMYMPQRGIAHGRAVAKVAGTLARALVEHGRTLDLDIVYNGGLLHDVAKGQPEHEARGAEMMRMFGLDQLAEVVGSHRDALPVVPEKLGEKEVVCLADKLVRGNQLVSVAERFGEKLILYKDDPEACKAIRSRMNTAVALQQAVEQVASTTIEHLLLAEEEG